MREDIARTRCAVCGCETGIRENKNGILYTYCRNSHHTRLSREDSREAVAAIRAGKKWTNGILYIYPNERKTDSGTGTTSTTNSTTGTNTTDNYRRTDGKHTATPTHDFGTTTGTDDSEDNDFGFGIL